MSCQKTKEHHWREKKRERGDNGSARQSGARKRTENTGEFIVLSKPGGQDSATRSETGVLGN